MSTVQMNVRIDDELKRRGDKALAEVGLSPSLAVRRLWEMASSPDGAQRVATFLGDSEAPQTKLDLLQKEEEALFALVDLVAGSADLTGVEPDYDELRYEAYLEKARERGVA